MPLRWDPNTFRYVDTGEEGGIYGSAYEGAILPTLPAAQQFGAGAAAALPGYYDNPYAQSAVERLYDPLYGQYLTGFGGVTGEEEPTQSFAKYAGEALRGGIPGGGLPGIVGEARPDNWQDILTVARARGLGYTGVQPGAELEDRWAPALSDQAQARALTALATYDPTAGSIYGRMRQRGLERLQRRFGAGEILGKGDVVLGGPASTTADWLAFITDPSRNIVPEQYQYRTPTYIEPDTELPVGYGRDPAWDFHLDPTMNPPPEGRREIVNPPPVVPVVNQAVNPPPVVPTSITPPSNIPLTPEEIEALANRPSIIPEPTYLRFNAGYGQTGANFDPTTGFPLDPTVSQSSTMFTEPTAGREVDQTVKSQPMVPASITPPSDIPLTPEEIEDLANRPSIIPEPTYLRFNAGYGQTGANFDPTTGYTPEQLAQMQRASAFPLDPTVSQSSTMFIEPTAGQSTTMFNQPPGTYNVAPPTTIPGVPGSNLPFSADWGLSASQAFGAPQVTLPNAYTQALYRIPGGAGYSVQAPGGSVPDPWQPIAWR